MRSAVAQKAFNSISEIERCDLALPDREHAPSQAFKRATCLGVAFDVPGELRLPIRPVRRRLPLTQPASVLMPEAPVDEQDRAMLRQHQVRRARQIAAVEAKSVAEPVDEAPDDDFGARIRSPDARHDGAALCRRVSVAHSWPPAALILSRTLVDAIRHVRAASLRVPWTDADTAFLTEDEGSLWWEAWLTVRTEVANRIGVAMEIET